MDVKAFQLVMLFSYFNVLDLAVKSKVTPLAGDLKESHQQRSGDICGADFHLETSVASIANLKSSPVNK